MVCVVCVDLLRWRSADMYVYVLASRTTQRRVVVFSGSMVETLLFVRMRNKRESLKDGSKDCVV